MRIDEEYSKRKYDVYIRDYKICSKSDIMVFECKYCDYNDIIWKFRKHIRYNKIYNSQIPASFKSFANRYSKTCYKCRDKLKKNEL